MNNTNQSLIQQHLEKINLMFGKSGLNRQIDGRTTPKDLIYVLQAALEKLGAHSAQLIDALKRAENIESIESKLDSHPKSFESDCLERRSWRLRKLQPNSQWKNNAQDGTVYDEEAQRHVVEFQQVQNDAWHISINRARIYGTRISSRLRASRMRTEHMFARVNEPQLQGIGELDSDKPLFVQRKERRQMRELNRQTRSLAYETKLDSNKLLLANRQERWQRRYINHQTKPLIYKTKIFDKAEYEVQLLKCCNDHPLLLTSAKPESYMGGVECGQCNRQVRVKLGFYRCASGCNYDVCKRCFNRDFREARRALAHGGRRHGRWMKEHTFSDHVDAGERHEPEQVPSFNPELPKREQGREDSTNKRGAKSNPWRFNANRPRFCALAQMHTRESTKCPYEK